MSSTPQRYPLEWPIDVPRVTRREGDRFKLNLTLSQALTDVLAELGRMGVRTGDVVISTNVRTRLDGLPYSGERPQNGDPGVAVYWRRSGQLHVMAVDRYARVEANVRAIALCIDAMRALERHGSKHVRDRAFGGFAALPAKASPSSWRAALGFAPEQAVTLDQVDAAYKRALLTAHPDRGGSTEQMSTITNARDDARREINGGKPA